MEINEKKIIKLYENGYSCRKIAKIYNSYVLKISKILKNNNIKVKTNGESLRKYITFEDYFDILDDQNKFYILGFLYADGYNDEKKRIVRLGLKDSDKKILEKIRNLICPNKPLRFYKQQNNIIKNKIHKISNIAVFAIDNSKISKKLAELGVVQRKSYILKYPDFIPEEYERHFIRGYFDGDGSASIQTKTNKNKTKILQISFCGTKDFLITLKIKLNKYLNFKITDTYYKRFDTINCCYCIYYGGRFQMLKFSDWLYKDSNLYLERKKNKFDMLKN